MPSIFPDRIEYAKQHFKTAAEPNRCKPVKWAHYMIAKAEDILFLGTMIAIIDALTTLIFRLFSCFNRSANQSNSKNNSPPLSTSTKAMGSTLINPANDEKKITLKVSKATQNTKVASPIETQQKDQAEAEQKTQLEAQQKAQAEAQQKAQLEAQQKAQREAQQKAQAEAQKRAQLEAQQNAAALAIANEQKQIEDALKLRATAYGISDNAQIKYDGEAVQIIQTISFDDE